MRVRALPLPPLLLLLQSRVRRTHQLGVGGAGAEVGVERPHNKSVESPKRPGIYLGICIYGVQALGYHGDLERYLKS